MGKAASWLGLLVLMAFAATAAFASVTFTPPDAKEVKLGTVVLKPEKAAGKARGTVSLVCSPDMSKGTLTIMASGLSPKKVYTVWLVEMPMKGGKMAKPAGKGMMMKMTGVGKPPYRLSVNAKGRANLAADVTDCKKVVMQMVKIVDHPSGDPKDMKKMTPIFAASLMPMMEEHKM